MNYLKLYPKVRNDPFVQEEVRGYIYIYTGYRKSHPSTDAMTGALLQFVEEVCRDAVNTDMAGAKHPGSFRWKRWWAKKAEIFSMTPHETDPRNNALNEMYKANAPIGFDPLMAYGRLRRLEQTTFIATGLIARSIPTSAYFK